ncbi:MAG: hypothetical protein ACO1QS_09750 [Verrucomicrobiota bacterium]
MNAESNNGELEIDYCAPLHAGMCECCRGTTTTLNRMVTRDGFPYSICQITYAETHPKEPARGIIGIGEFGEGTSPRQRVAFGISLRPVGIMVVDATDELWPDTEILGQKLSREAALKHPSKTALFRLVDKLYAEDKVLREYFKKVSTPTPPR